MMLMRLNCDIKIKWFSALLIAVLLFIAGCGASSSVETEVDNTTVAPPQPVATTSQPATTTAVTETAHVEEIEDSGLNGEFFDVSDSPVDDRPPVALVAGYAVTQSEFHYMLNSYKSALMLNSGFNAGADEDVYFWSRISSNGRTRLDEAREKVLLELHQLKVCEVISESTGIKLDADELENISTDLMAKIDRFGGRDGFERILSDEYGISLADYWQISVLAMLREKLYAAERDSIEVSEDEMRAYYEQNLDKYGDIVMLRLILFLTEGAELSVERTAEETKELAEETLDALKSGADMATLVIEKSEDPNVSTNRGAYLATMADPFLPKEITTWAFGAQEGDYSIVETSFGFYVVCLENRISRLFEDSKQEIENELKENRLSERIADWLANPEYALQIDKEVLDSMT